jgi:hypothetical protein
VCVLIIINNNCIDVNKVIDVSVTAHTQTVCLCAFVRIEFEVGSLAQRERFLQRFAIRKHRPTHTHTHTHTTVGHHRHTVCGGGGGAAGSPTAAMK